MINDWIAFSIAAVCGVAAIVCVFEGTRRLGAPPAGRNAVLMVVFGGLFCVAWGALAFWDHWTRNEAIETLRQKVAVQDLPAGLAKMPAAKREKLGEAHARAKYIEGGNLGTYRDRKGAAKLFAPSQADIKQREYTVFRRTQLEHASRDSFADAFLWWIWGLLAALFGYLVSREKRTPPSR
jgi:hypothetical protein